jgi:signal transduction histidine kinase
MEQAGQGKSNAPWALTAGLWAWLAAALVLAAAGWLSSAGRIAPALALGLAATPALAMFAILPHWQKPWAGDVATAAWTGFALAAAIATGGLGSALNTAFLIAPALAARRGDPRAQWEALGFSALGVTAAGLIAAYVLPQAAAPPALLSTVGGIACLALAGWVLAAPISAPKPAPRPTPRPLSASAMQAAAMAHELRTPLTHILGFAEVMEQQIFGPLSDKYVEYAGLIRTSGAHLLGLVNDLMDLARIEAGRWRMEPEKLDAAPVCREAMALAQGQAGLKSIVLHADVAGSLPVLADPRALRHILLNLVGNAVKFTPDAGRVSLRAARDHKDLVLIVTDTGPGFPPAAFGRLATPFERGDNVADAAGTGLGLALVKALAQAQGGALILANGDQEGAIVTVRLPIMLDS